MEVVNNLYPFDLSFIEVPINIRPNAETPVNVCHRLRKPTVDQLSEREQQVRYEMVELSSREEEFKTDEESANAKLWDKIAVAVKGYRGFEDWRDLTDEDRSVMRPGHKAAAIRALYAGSCEVEGEDEAVSIGADIWTVTQKIGIKQDSPDFTVKHTLREPTEAERARFKRTASSTVHIKGAKKPQTRVRTNLKAYIELYDALVQEIDGATVGGKPLRESGRRDFLVAIDPIWKRLVVHEFMGALEASLLD